MLGGFYCIPSRLKHFDFQTFGPTFSVVLWFLNAVQWIHTMEDENRQFFACTKL